MSSIIDEMKSYLGSGKMTDEEFLIHYGMPRRSGRYPYGSGKDPYQHGDDLLSRIEKLKDNGWTETPENIRKEFGISTTDYIREKRLCNESRRSYRIATAKSLKKDGLGATEIGRRMGLRESTVREYLKQDQDSKISKTKETADFLRERVNELKMVDVGSGVENELNISKDRLDTAIYMLEKEGYHKYEGRIPQPTNKNQSTTMKVLAAPDIQHKEIFEFDRVHSLHNYISRDGGKNFEKKFTYPSSMDSKRLKICYAEDGGIKKDGLIELRRGVPDLSLGESRYSQVRILVDGKKYIKGMAVYSDNLPDGVDVVFNTNKSRSVPKLDVLKDIKSDPDNPFGSNIKDSELGGQYWYDSKTGKKWDPDNHIGEKKLGLINKRSDEGDWTEWQDSLPSQFLSKQSLTMAKKQLNLAKADKMAELDTIKSLNNPVIKKYYLNKFADSCDAAATDLKAAALPGQKYHVIIPIPELKDTEIFAPQYEPGTQLALIRYPHGGTFEIPILTVNNKNKKALKVIGNDSIDAVGITSNVAERLSGADFDGDTVMCIPTNDSKGKVKIKSTKPLEGLVGFDNKLSYGYDKVEVDGSGEKHYFRAGQEFPIMKATNKEMGVISNLITDMTLGGASSDELAAAVRHSMVVIDAAKHKLDYKQSYRDNNIAALQKKYQTKYDKDGNIIGGGGASTLISRSKGQKAVLKRKGEAHVNMKDKPWYDPSRPEGVLLYNTAPDNELYYVPGNYDKKTGVKKYETIDGNKIVFNGKDSKAYSKYNPIFSYDDKGKPQFTSKDGIIKYKIKARTTDSKNMLETDDANKLVSSYKWPMELIYADYANGMKALANSARKIMMTTENIKTNSQAKKVYSKEISSLEAKLNNAMKNKPREREALRRANIEIKNKKELNPDMKPDDIKKISQRAMSKYRDEVNSIKRRDRAIEITDKEWEAIQSGAISTERLKKILDNSDPDILRERAMPTEKRSLNDIQINRIKAMNSSNFTLEEIAKKMNISTSSVYRYLKGVK